MANKKWKKSHGDLIQNSDLPKKMLNSVVTEMGSLLTKISFTHNLQLNQWAYNG